MSPPSIVLSHTSDEPLFERAPWDIHPLEMHVSIVPFVGIPPILPAPGLTVSSHPRYSYKPHLKEIETLPLTALDPLYDLRGLLEEIKNRPSLVAYMGDVKRWLRYLREVEHRNMRLTMAKGSGDTNETVLLEFEYPHRWRDVYREMLLAKLYTLEAALREDCVYTLMSLTTYQGGKYSREKVGGYTIPQSFEVLADRGRALMNQVKRRIAPNLQYFWAVEPHMLNDSGYPHRHYMLDREFTEEEMERIRHIWADIYLAGSPEHGIDFSVRETEGSVRSVKNYLMAYLAKSISPSQLTAGELVYHAVAYRHRYRFWGASRGWSALMRREGVVPSGKWLKTEVVDEWGDVVHTVRSALPVEYLEEDADYYNRLVRLSPAEVAEDAEMVLEQIQFKAEQIQFREDCRRQTEWEEERRVRAGAASAYLSAGGPP